MWLYLRLCYCNRAFPIKLSAKFFTNNYSSLTSSSYNSRNGRRGRVRCMGCDCPQMSILRLAESLLLFQGLAFEALQSILLLSSSPASPPVFGMRLLVLSERLLLSWLISGCYYWCVQMAVTNHTKNIQLVHLILCVLLVPLSFLHE